jgi:hypothetical protein
MTSCNLAPNHNERMDILRQQLNSRLMWMSRHADLSRSAHNAALQQLLIIGITLIFSYESFARADRLIFGVTPFLGAMVLGIAAYAVTRKHVSRANAEIRAHNDTCPEMTNGYEEAHAADSVRESAAQARAEKEAAQYNRDLVKAQYDVAHPIPGLENTSRGLAESTLQELVDCTPEEWARRRGY